LGVPIAARVKSWWPSGGAGGRGGHLQVAERRFLAMPPHPRSDGPARFFARHPRLFAAAVALAAGSAVLLEARSAVAKGPARKAGWSLLALLEWGVVAGLLTLPFPADGDPRSPTPSQTL
jgi:hypothetical protein